ncbi:MAG: DNA polymerase IV [Bacteroidales bacterium]|jgi:DNA polymerase-4|nr:DNA polymerase IV [Bacteroidales bacterium]
MSVRKIIHIDMDAFYASVEERDFPHLKGKPLAVGKNKERGVIATANYEARKYGVHSAMSSKIALQKCPILIFQPPRFAVYKAVSDTIHSIFKEYTDLVEPLSLDEAYLDVTENKKGIPSATIIAREIKEKIHAQTQLTASAGISYNKFLAKIASDYQKPNGMFTILPSEAVNFLETLPVEKFFGIGKITASHLHSKNIFTGFDLQKKTKFEMIELFGKSGLFFYNIVRGIDERNVEPHRERKSFSVETTFDKDLTSNFAVITEMYHLEQRLWNDITISDKLAKTVTIKIRFADFSTQSKSYSFDSPVTNFQDFHTVTKKLLSLMNYENKPIRLLGVGLSNLFDTTDLRDIQLKLNFER